MEQPRSSDLGQIKTTMEQSGPRVVKKARRTMEPSGSRDVEKPRETVENSGSTDEEKPEGIMEQSGPCDVEKLEGTMGQLGPSDEEITEETIERPGGTMEQSGPSEVINSEGCMEKPRPSDEEKLGETMEQSDPSVVETPWGSMEQPGLGNEEMPGGSMKQPGPSDEEKSGDSNDEDTMVVKPKRAGVRFQLGPIQKSPLSEQTLLKDVPLLCQDTGRDSGAPSPDFSPTMQPASVRLEHNERRMKIMAIINDIVKIRAEDENAQSRMNRLADELNAQFQAAKEEDHTRKDEQLKRFKISYEEILAKKHQMDGQLAILQEHYERHEREHAAHSTTADDDQEVPVTLSTLPGSIKDKKPSKKADQKLAAGRLLREITDLRNLLAVVERKLLIEIRKKKQAEEELSVLRAAENRSKGKKQDKPTYGPAN